MFSDLLHVNVPIDNSTACMYQRSLCPWYIMRNALSLDAMFLHVALPLVSDQINLALCFFFILRAAATLSTQLAGEKFTLLKNCLAAKKD